VKAKNDMTLSGCNSISLSLTSFIPLYTKSKSYKHGRSSLKFSGGFFMKIFYISTSTSNALISSLLSDYSAFVIL
jgi:hypothetical protein